MAQFYIFLQTYFFDTDNPLHGLSLSKGNVAVKQDYEAILKFYGFNLSMDMTSLLKDSTTVLINANEVTSTTSMYEIIDEEIAISGDLPNTTLTPTTTVTSTPDSLAINATDAETISSTEAIMLSIDSSAVSNLSSTEKSVTLSPNEVNNEAAELISSIGSEGNAELPIRLQKARVSRLHSAKLQATTTTIKMPNVSYLPIAHMQSSRYKNVRDRRHLLPLSDVDTNIFGNIFQYNKQEFPAVISNPPAIEHQYFDVYGTEPSHTKQIFNTDIISHVFYLGNEDIVYTTFKVYDAVLYYKYFANLQISVVEFELNTPEYNLMIILPDRNSDLVSAASALKRAPNMRLLRKHLKAKWVQAIIPDFKLQGTVFLTNDLQNMGIADIFEPSRANFQPMTDEKSAYVRHIEQFINITIRTHPIIQFRRSYGTQAKPIPVSINHPFLFFIIDRDMETAVMSGRILNPLNVRIQ